MPIAKKVLSSFLIVLLGIPFFAQTTQESADPDESLKYRVSVNVMVVPVFAVDSKGKPAKEESEKAVTLRVPLPNVMRNRKVDMFLIHMDPDTQKTDINLLSSSVTDVVNIRFKPRQGKNQFFVVIEPTTPYRIYNKI